MKRRKTYRNFGYFGFNGYEAPRVIADSLLLKRAQAMDLSNEFPVGNFSYDISNMTLTQLQTDLTKSKAELAKRMSVKESTLIYSGDTPTEEKVVRHIWAVESAHEVYFHIQDIENRIGLLDGTGIKHGVESRKWVQDIIGNEFGPFSKASQTGSQAQYDTIQLDMWDYTLSDMVGGRDTRNGTGAGNGIDTGTDNDNSIPELPNVDTNAKSAGTGANTPVYVVLIGVIGIVVYLFYIAKKK
uniref:Uncharacterized protein n=1 Tax=viral metagenome TaxID=1070528 RepID=A0A6M3J7Q6_9ZZZZ